MGDTTNKKRTIKERKTTDPVAALRKSAEKRLKSETARLRELSSADLKKLVHELGTHQIELEMQNEELRSARVELESSRARYAGLYDFAPVGYFTFDRSGLISEVNLTGSVMLGSERRLLLRKPIVTFIEQADRKSFRDHLRDAFAARASVSCEISLVKKDGAKFSTQWNSLFVAGQDGGPDLCRTAISDITERNRAEGELKESEKKYRTLFENMLDGYAYCKMLYDDRGRPEDFVYLVVNSAFGRLTGLESVVGRKVTDVIPGIWESHPELLVIYGRVAATGLPEKFEMEFKPLDRWYSISVYSTERDYFAAVFDNITERKRVEDAQRRANIELETQVQERTRELQMTVFALQDQVQERAKAESDLRISRDKLRSTLEGTRVINALLKQLTQITTCKEYLDSSVTLIRTWSGCRYAGIRIADDAGRIPYAASVGFTDEFLQSESMLMIGADHCACTRVIAGTPEPQDLPVLTPNGSFFSNNTQRFVQGLTEQEQGRYRGVCIRSGFSSVAVIPIAYRRKVLGAIHLADEREYMAPIELVEEAEQMALIIGEAIMRFGVEEERTRLSSAVESAADGVAITEPVRGMIQYVNPAFERITGFSRNEAVGANLHILDSGKQDEAFYRTVRETIRRSDGWQGRIVSRRKGGMFYFEDRTCAPVRDHFGRIINYVTVMRDVTERLRLESIGESVSAMDTIGSVFAGVRHEIGNPINSVSMILGILESKLETLAPEAVRNYLGKMEGHIARVEYLLKSLKNFNLYETQEPLDVPIAEFLESFLPLIKEDFERRGISVVIEAVSAGVTVRADPRALQQVLLNVFINAADAMNEHRTPQIRASVSRSDGIVRIRVQDNGCGIPEDKLNEIFKPFYTTKTSGTGLGLVIVRKMLARMNGTIAIESRADAGTQVEIVLPEGVEGSAER